MSKESSHKVNEKARNAMLETIIQSLIEKGHEVLKIETNAIAIPFVNELKEESFFRVVVSVPRGSKTDVFCGYALKEEYERKTVEKEEKRKQQEITKQRKIKQDEERRKNRKKIDSAS